MADDGGQHTAVNAVAQARNKVERGLPALCPQLSPRVFSQVHGHDTVGIAMNQVHTRDHGRHPWWLRKAA